MAAAVVTLNGGAKRQVAAETLGVAQLVGKRVALAVVADSRGFSFGIASDCLGWCRCLVGSWGDSRVNGLVATNSLDCLLARCLPIKNYPW